MVDIDGVGCVESWHELIEVHGRLITFRSMVRFLADDVLIESVSTLCFRDRSELAASLQATGYDVVEVRDAPDRPDLEYVFIANRQ